MTSQLRSGQVSAALSRSSSLPINRAYRQAAAVTTGGQSTVGSSLQSGINKSSEMGNKHTHLNGRHLYTCIYVIRPKHLHPLERNSHESQGFTVHGITIVIKQSTRCSGNGT